MWLTVLTLCGDTGPLFKYFKWHEKGLPCAQGPLNSVPYGADNLSIAIVASTRTKEVGK